MKKLALFSLMFVACAARADEPQEPNDVADQNMPTGGLIFSVRNKLSGQNELVLIDFSGGDTESDATLIDDPAYMKQIGEGVSQPCSFLKEELSDDAGQRFSLIFVVLPKSSEQQNVFPWVFSDQYEVISVRYIAMQELKKITHELTVQQPASIAEPAAEPTPDIDAVLESVQDEPIMKEPGMFERVGVGVYDAYQTIRSLPFGYKVTGSVSLVTLGSFAVYWLLPEHA